MNLLEATPKLLVTLFLMLLTLPALSMILGFDLGFSTHLHDKQQFYYVLYCWTISIISILILLLSFLNYSQSGHEVIYTIGTASFFSAYFNVLITVFYKWIYTLPFNVENLHAYFWIFSNTAVGLIICMGLTLLIFTSNTKILHVSQLLFLAVLLGIASFWFYGVIFDNLQPRTIIYPSQLIEYPLGAVNFIFYGYILYLSYYFKDTVSIWLTRLLFWLGITQCTLSLYVISGLIKLYDSSFIGSTFLQLLSYLIILVFISLHYFFNYKKLVDLQNEIKREKEQFEKLSHEDPLTSLANRRALEIEGERAIACAQRGLFPFMIVFLDIDDFKKINDNINHDVGDKILQQVADRLKKSLRANDFCARFGGDEFVIILYGNDSEENIDLILSKITHTLNQCYYVDENEISVKISVGTAAYPKDGATISDLLKVADRAMYQNKQTIQNSN